jgi:hypothetical protein
VRDLTRILTSARERDIPVIVGSAGGAGTDAGVSMLAEVVQAIAKDNGYKFRLATIYAEQQPSSIAKAYEDGKLEPMPGTPPCDADRIQQCTHIVAMMGVEPIQEAINAGADVVIAGRSTDAAIFASLPLLRGFNPGLVWHAGKLLECGAASAVHRLQPDSMLVRVFDNHFVAWPPNPALYCSPHSVAAHTLYENASPYHLYEPSGMLDTTNSQFDAGEDSRSVLVRGSRFIPSDAITIKIEGATFVGYQSLTIAGIRDPVILEQLDDFLARGRESIEQRLESKGYTADTYLLNFRIYGHSATLGKLEPERERMGHEIGLVIEATATTQEIASEIVADARYILLHQPVQNWRGFTTNLALPYAPATLNRGPVYEFALNHLLRPENAMDLFRIEVMDIR